MDGLTAVSRACFTAVGCPESRHKMSNEKEAIYNNARFRQSKLNRLGCKSLLTHLSEQECERFEKIASREALRYSLRLTQRSITIDDYISLLNEILDWLHNNRHRRDTTERLLDNIEESAICLRESHPFLPAIPHFTRPWQVRDWRTSAKKEMALKRRDKKKELPAESRLLAVLINYQKDNQFAPLAKIAREARVSRKTAYKCLIFCSAFEDFK
jgi:hypothetical protein